MNCCKIKIIKMKTGFVLSLFTLFIVMACNMVTEKNKETNSPDISKAAERDDLSKDTIYNSKNLIIVRLSAHTYQHISFLNTNDFGRVSCNGMLVLKDNRAIVFDTPADDESSEELIKYVNQNLKSTIIAIIPTHFHDDCVGGMQAFNKHKIQSYASNKTIQFLKNKGNKYASLMKGFEDSLTLNVGKEKVIAQYFGEGHTKDNIIGYFPADSSMFGGCLIQELDATKGNLEDANTIEWPFTVLKLKRGFPNTTIIIPGHGKSGGKELLDYTETLFK